MVKPEEEEARKADAVRRAIITVVRNIITNVSREDDDVLVAVVLERTADNMGLLVPILLPWSGILLNPNKPDLGRR